MRILLDAHISGPKIGRRLTAKGHDVRALDQEPVLEGLPDDDVLQLATYERRILVTHNIRDFPNIAREWAAAQREHAGLILIYGIGLGEFGVITRGVQRWLLLYPEQKSWTDFATVVDRTFASS